MGIIAYGTYDYTLHPGLILIKTEQILVVCFILGGVILNAITLKFYFEAVQEDKLLMASPVKGIELNKEFLCINSRFVGGIANKWMKKHKKTYLELPWQDIKEIDIEPAVNDYSVDRKHSFSTPSALRVVLNNDLSHRSQELKEFMSKFMDQYADIWVFRKYLNENEKEVVDFITANNLTKLNICSEVN